MLQPGQTTDPKGSENDTAIQAQFFITVSFPMCPKLHKSFSKPETDYSGAMLGLVPQALTKPFLHLFQKLN
jgi:hypothetical protein